MLPFRYDEMENRWAMAKRIAQVALSLGAQRPKRRRICGEGLDASTGPFSVFGALASVVKSNHPDP